MKTARQLLENASRFSEFMMTETGTVRAMYHMLTREGEELVIPAPPLDDKDMIVAVVRDLFKELDVVAYVFLCEAWALKVEEYFGQRPSEHPDRIEIVMIQAQDALQEISGSREIIRSGDKVTLGPLAINDASMSEGRMVGMLPRTETLQ